MKNPNWDCKITKKKAHHHTFNKKNFPRLKINNVYQGVFRFAVCSFLENNYSFIRLYQKNIVPLQP